MSVNKTARKTISKETQEAIKRFLTSNISTRTISPCTPKIELDAHFSKILKKKREEQLEASKQRLFDSTVSNSDTLVDINVTGKNCESYDAIPLKKDVAVELDNSMLFGKPNKSWNESIDEDSFLALERQCHMDDIKERLANDTMLCDVEPPSDLWNETVNQSLTVASIQQLADQDSDESDTIEISPVKYVGLIRPSTIIEETSSQMESSSKNSSASATISSSSYLTASINESVNETSTKSCDRSNDSHKKAADADGSTNVSPLCQRNTQTTKTDRQRRGTFAFKRANYTFFPNENLEPINESGSFDTQSPNLFKEEAHKTPTAKSSIRATTGTKTSMTGSPTVNLLDFQANNDRDIENDDEDQFNNTLERVDYLLEKGKQILEETPIAKRGSHHHSILETPLFSCKRKRLLSEMASIEMLPLPKRGPLIDFSTPEASKQTRNGRFNELH